MDCTPELPPEVWHKVLFDYDLSPADVAAVRLVVKNVVWPHGLDLAKWQALAGWVWCMKNNRPRALVLSLEREQPGWLGEVLAWGCSKGHLAVVQYCISRGCRHIFGYGTFHQAAKGGHVDIVRLLCESFSTVTYHVVLGYCEGGHLDLLKAFGLEGFHPSQIPRAVSLASREGHSEVVRYLVSMAAAHPEVDITRLLIEMSALGNLDAVDALISEGADPSAYGGRAFREARYRGHSEVLARLLEDPRMVSLRS
jgi:hypothetical protein